jgi:RNA polymerase sigma-70 factor (ECF subfamily)
MIVCGDDRPNLMGPLLSSLARQHINCNDWVAAYIWRLSDAWLQPRRQDDILASHGDVLMNTQPAGDITQLLSSISKGDSAAATQLLDIVYSELHRLAGRYMSRERVDHSLQTTGLVHEAYIRLFGTNNLPSLNDRGHFFAVAANQMRRILVDHARQNCANKRRGISIPIDEAYHISSGRDEDVIAVDDALKELAEIDSEGSKVVELRFFGGYTDKETAEILGKNLARVRRDWEFARSWLYARLDNT